MALINLRDIFPEYTLDCFVEVLDDDEETFKASLTKEIADVYFKEQREENKYKRKIYRYKAHYSLNQDDGIENEIVSDFDDPVFEEFVCKLDKQRLFDAIADLPEAQGKRIYTKFILGISQVEIARNEGVAESAVNQAIERGLRNLEKKLKSFF